MNQIEPGGSVQGEEMSPRPPSGRSAGQIVLDASLILAVTAVASRLLGWVRLVVIGSQFGASKELDAYFAAFLIPDAIFQLVVAGALFTALVPVFVSYRARDQEEEAWRVASSVVNILVLGLAGVALLMAIFAPVLVPFVAPGFDAPTTALTVRLTRIMLLSPIFIGFGAVVTGILNTYDRWAVPAMAPLVYNLSIIFAAIFVAPILGVEALAVGVAVGSLLHLAIQLPSLAAVGQRYDLTLGLRHPGVRRVALLTAPRTLGLAAGQINLIVSTALASGLAQGSVAAYNYAFQLSMIPAGVVGVSIAVALFPTLSRDAALGRLSEIRRQVAASLRVIIFIALPITAIMVVLAEPITGVFFQYGLFDARAASRTAGALVFFAVGLAANSAVHVLVRAFYAMHDTRTPVLWAILAVVVNVPLMVWLVGPMGIGGLALALSITATGEAIGLVWALRNRIHSIEGAAIARSVLRAGVAAAAAALLMLGGLEVVHSAFAGLEGTGLGRLAVLIVLAGAGLAIYVLVAGAMRSPELAQLREMAGRRLRRSH